MQKEILIIDDSKSLRQVVHLTLKSKGYLVHEAENGREALQKLAGPLGATKLCLIICDVNMPEMDGLTFLRNMKSEAAYAAHKFTPVIMLTTESEEEKRMEGQQGGAKAWMVKPFQPDRLLKAVETLAG